MLAFCSSTYLLISWKEPGLAGAGSLHCRQILYCLSHQGSPVTWMNWNVRSSCLRKMEHLVFWQSWSHISRVGWHTAIMSHCDYSPGHYCDQHHHWHYCPRHCSHHGQGQDSTHLCSPLASLSPPSQLFSAGGSPSVVLTSLDAVVRQQWVESDDHRCPRAPSALSFTLFQDGGAVQGIWKSQKTAFLPMAVPVGKIRL